MVQIHTTDVHEDELIDGIDTLWGGDEMGSGTDEDDSDGDMEEELFVPPPPSEDVIERQIRDEFAQWKHRTRQRSDLQDQDYHFNPWSDVGNCLPYTPREAFAAKEGLLKRIRPERQDRVEDRVTSLEVFQDIFTPEMMKRIVWCTHARVELIKKNEYPKLSTTLPKVLLYFPPLQLYLKFYCT